VEGNLHFAHRGIVGMAERARILSVFHQLLQASLSIAVISFFSWKE
jgi:hypothetical protein